MTAGRLRTALVVLVVALVVGAVFATAASDDDEVPAAGGTGNGPMVTSTSSTSIASSAAAQDSSEAGTAPLAAPAVTVTTAAVTPSPVRELAAKAEPPPSRPPRAGTYRYRAVEDGGTREISTAVEDRGADGDIVKQLVTVQTEEGSIATDFEWRPASAHGTRSRLQFGSVTVDCDWEPDVLFIRLPVRRGLAWESDSSCSTTIFGQPATLKLSIRARVADAKRVQVAAGTFDVWVTDTTETLMITSPSFSVTRQRSGTTWYAPELGVPVRQVLTVKTTSPQGEREHRSETELLSRPT